MTPILSKPQFFLFSRPSMTDIERVARETEALGYDGLALTDSQNLSPDTYMALTLAARVTTRLVLGPGVTNPVTRHAAVNAGAIASLQLLSGGRAMFGIGRGDSALFNIGHKPAPVKSFEAYVADVQCYLGGGTMERTAIQASCIGSPTADSTRCRSIWRLPVRKSSALAHVTPSA